jgi:hypothetical protein
VAAALRRRSRCLLRTEERDVDREPYVRVSIWSADGECEAAVSIDEAEAARLVDFLADLPPPRRRRLRDALGALAGAR